MTNPYWDLHQSKTREELSRQGFLYALAIIIVVLAFALHSLPSALISAANSNRSGMPSTERVALELE